MSAPVVIRATAEHVEECRQWLVRRGLGDAPADLFSSTGFVVPGVAAVWLYLTSSSLAFLEMLIGNPDVPKDVRDVGLDAVLEAAIAEARANGVRLLLGVVQNPIVEARCLKHGLAPLGRGLTLISRAFQPGEVSSCPSR